ncbi:MAG TPA: gamma-glutamylcyclotransferase family protein [Thermoanaerobaculia bacterium]|nr:gamma-glutamylcyclotransferase family protein [Thermoanaerobaculia bacterium]
MSGPYFAYGANLDRDAMRRRAPGSRFAGRAAVEGWRFVIDSSGWASIVSEAGARVEGALWLLTPEDERSLDGFEGVADGLYRRIEVDVSLEGGGVRRAWAYAATAGGTGRPGRDYLEQIVRAARSLGFSDRYLSELESWLS